jgi:hypothetical protein
MRLEGLGKLKKSTSSRLETATFRLVAQCLNQLRYRVPHYFCIELLEIKNAYKILGSVYFGGESADGKIILK